MRTDLGAAALAEQEAPDLLPPEPGPADIYPVPPLAWSPTASPRQLDISQNEKIIRFLISRYATKIVYGGNAMVYHMTLRQYSELIEWLSPYTRQAAIIPAVGPAFGRALDQAELVRRHRFHSLLVLPSASDPRDASGLETGLREISDAAGLPLALYIRDESNFGPDRDAGLDLIARLLDDKTCSLVKYAIARKDPSNDPYLRALLSRVNPSQIVSGIGERPAVVHLRLFDLAGFTTGSGVLAPRLCRRLLNACRRHDYSQAERIRSLFLPLEDLRDSWGPPKVLHYAVSLANLADTGPVLPFLSPLTAAQLAKLKPVARTLLDHDQEYFE
jgi:4-hydroxy-tetrahydrodipicolinate synthase